MATTDYRRITGRSDVRNLLVDSGTVLIVGDLVQTDESAGDLVIAVTNQHVGGIALEASISGSTTAINYDVIGPTDIFRARITTGTGAASEKGKFADIAASNDGITLTESNNDMRIVNWQGDTGFVDVKFTSTESPGPDTV